MASSKPPTPKTTQGTTRVDTTVKTTERRDTTPYYPTDSSASTKNYDTTTKKQDPTATTMYPSTTRNTTRPTPDPSTHKPNPDLNCYGHFTYKEGHNIIVDGKYNRHHDPLECEISCYDVTDCRFWKFTGGNGLEQGFCELNSGEPLGHAEVIGQKDVKLINTGNKTYCEFPPNHHHPH